MEKLTIKAVRESLAGLGYTLRKSDGEYRVCRKGAGEDAAYYTNELADALGTAQADAERHAARTPAVAFFYENAGYGYNPASETREQGRERGAVALANAEAYAKSNGYAVAWEHDPHADDSFLSARERAHAEFYSAVLYAPSEEWWNDDAREVVASLHGIHNPDSAYRRVVAAELMLDAMDRVPAAAL